MGSLFQLIFFFPWYFWGRFDWYADGYDPLDPHANITIKWDLMIDNGETYDVSSSIICMILFSSFWVSQRLCFFKEEGENTSCLSFHLPGSDLLGLKGVQYLRIRTNDMGRAG